MTRSLPGAELARQYLLALYHELGVRGVTCALRNIGEDVMLQVHYGNGVTCGDDPGDTVTVAVISGQWWYCWPETMIIGPVTPPARAAQAIIGELGLGGGGEQTDTGIADLAVRRMLRQARLSISVPPAERPRDTP